LSTPPWEAEFPGRLEHELSCLEAAGIRYDIDDEARRVGILRMRVTAIEGRPTDLTVTFPDLYPFVRPSVRLSAEDSASMAHHVHPLSGDLCLLGRSTSLWRTDDTLAWLLTTQLPKTLTAGRAIANSAEELAALSEVEEVQAEPWTDYYTCFAPGSMVLVDSSWVLPEAASQGVLQLRLSRFEPGHIDGAQGVGFLQGAVFTVADEKGRPLGEMTGLHQGRFQRPITGRWVRLEAPLRADDAEAFLAEVRRVAPRLLDMPWQDAGNGWDVQVFGLSFPEERVHRGTGDGWVFLVRVRPPGRSQQPPRGGRGRRGPAPVAPRITAHLVRAGYAGAADMSERVPELSGLGDRHVAVLGAGALGSTVVEHLARAGVGQLTVLDRDHLEPGNLVRHAGTLDMVGCSKAAAAVGIAWNVAPRLAAAGRRHALGAPRDAGEQRSELDFLGALIDDVDLVVDCTAETGLAHALSWLARRRGKPYLVASATNGGWGGRVLRLSPAPGAACWACLEFALDDGSIPSPPSAPEEAGVQPVGCADPTFTGAGFDLAEVSLHAVRVAVATLQAGQPNGYPDSGHELQVLAMRTPEGVPIPPTWTGLALPVHPLCRGDH
jgi:molybdopterin/thiamine biosynthesis adenylyltransferase